MSGAHAAPVLDADSAAFIVRASVTNAVAARDANRMPSVGKALGARVSADRRTVEVFIDAERMAAVVRDLRAGSPIAVVFSEPGSHRTIQLKAPGARVEPLAVGDEALVARHVQGIVAHLAPLGYAPAAMRMYFGYTPQHLVRIVFAPTDAFAQTPGPGAGARLPR